MMSLFPLSEDEGFGEAYQKSCKEIVHRRIMTFMRRWPSKSSQSEFRRLLRPGSDFEFLGEE